MVERLRDRKKGQQKTALADWKSEGGSVAEPAPATPCPYFTTGDTT
jgi:hypothetical protein